MRFEFSFIWFLTSYTTVDEYVDFGEVMRWDTAYSLTIALVLFIAVMQTFQPMDFSQELTSLKVLSILRMRKICDL